MLAAVKGMKIKNLEIDRGMRLTSGFCLTSSSLRPFLACTFSVFLGCNGDAQEGNTPQRFDLTGRVVFVYIVTDVTFPTDLLMSDRAEGIYGKKLFISQKQNERVSKVCPLLTVGPLGYRSQHLCLICLQTSEHRFY